MKAVAVFFSSNIIVAALLWAAVMAVPIPTLNAHAIKRHPDTAPLVKRCLEEMGPSMIWRQRDGNFVLICVVAAGVYGQMVCTPDGECITAFIREKIKTMADFVNHLSKEGATPAKKVPWMKIEEKILLALILLIAVNITSFIAMIGKRIAIG